LRILSADLQQRALPSLASRNGQALVEEHFDGIDLVIIDSVSTLCATDYGANEEKSWEAMQDWLLSLRRRGFTVLIVYHEGKGLLQRGTSKREDVLSQVIQLKRPSDYSPSQGARFEVHLTKARGLFGEDAEPFEAQLQTDPEGQAVWTWRSLSDATKSRVLSLYRDGVTSQRAIASELKVGVGTVNRKLKLLREEGVIERNTEGRKIGG